MSKDNFEQRLQEELDRLPREIQPQRELWPGIDLAIENEVQERFKGPRWIGVAAALGVISLLSVLTINKVDPPSTQETALHSLVNNFSQQHEEQKVLLLTSYEKQPALTDNWREQLAELEAAAVVIRKALEEDPGDSKLIGLLQQVYQQQIKLIRSVHQPKWL